MRTGSRWCWRISGVGLIRAWIGPVPLCFVLRARHVKVRYWIYSAQIPRLSREMFCHLSKVCWAYQLVERDALITRTWLICGQLRARVGLLFCGRWVMTANSTLLDLETNHLLVKNCCAEQTKKWDERRNFEEIQELHRFTGRSREQHAHHETVTVRHRQRLDRHWTAHEV